MAITHSRRNFLQRAAQVAGISTLAPAMTFGTAAFGNTGSNTETGADKSTPTARFLAAAAAGDLPAVQGLLDTDPGLLHVRDEAGRSAFVLALLGRHSTVGALLRERGYTLDVTEAALALDWERFEALAKAAPGTVNADHPVGGTAMVAAAIGGAGDSIWRVYQYGGDPDANPRGADGFTAVRAAMDHPDLVVAEHTAWTLLANGGDANAPQAGGSSPLHGAAKRGSTYMVEVVLRKGGRVDAVDAEGHTPLQVAEAHGHEAAATMLRRHREIPRDHSTSRFAYDVNGAPYRPADLSGYAVVPRNQLVGAAHFKLDTVKETLARHPQFVHAISSAYEGAVEACAHTGRHEIVDYLLERGAPYSLLTAVLRNDTARVRALLKEDPLRIHEHGPHDFALLWYPIIGGGHLDLATLLLDAGAEVERQHYLGTTALHWAALGGLVDMTALLIERGADINRVGRKFDPQGQTPLQLARHREREDVVRLLQQKGARG